jgi:hypothetical protein
MQGTGALHLLMTHKKEYRFGRSFFQPEHPFHRVFHVSHFRPGYTIPGSYSLGLKLHICVLLADPAYPALYCYAPGPDAAFVYYDDSNHFISKNTGI